MEYAALIIVIILCLPCATWLTDIIYEKLKKPK